jgi:anti-anti-sigma factor
MTFTADLCHEDRTAVLTLTGDLDTPSAQVFQDQMQRAINGQPDRLVLDLTALRHLTSAAVRVLVVARQKLADEVPIILVGAQTGVERTIRLIGIDRSLVFSDARPGDR